MWMFLPLLCELGKWIDSALSFKSHISYTIKKKTTLVLVYNCVDRLYYSACKTDFQYYV